ncbi:hypothetical protein Daus18300_009803 [Diaporthe australafricana]|uniref:F-box domain-containing protein n=1 Tax=Diaporthe australafricana TaxID=127596 RepID=A0ABR3WCV3_9PEZI
MDVLSGELLLAILLELKSISPNKDFFSCLLVCKKWTQTATPLLYGNIALVGSRAVGLFARCFQPSLYGEHVRSVTLKFERDDAEGDNTKELRLVASILPQLGNLSSLSLHTRANPASPDALISLLEALPVSCTSLELDTYHDDVYGLGGNIQPAHLCDSLRAILPRMHHARIRTGIMCGAMFGEGNLPDEAAPCGRPGSKPFVPIHLPHMRSLLVVCARQSLLFRCGAVSTNHMNILWADLSGSAWLSVTTALEQLVQTPGAVRQAGDASICAVGITDYDQDDMVTWKAIVRADVVAKVSWAVPYRMVWHSGIPGSWVVRLPDGRELMTTLQNIEQLAEGEEWVSVSGGVRLPRSVMEDKRAGRPSFAVGCVPEPMPLLKTAEQWRQDNPKKMTYVWRNEAITGEKLVEAEKRMGRDEYLSLQPVLERTPVGWCRGYRNESLERVQASTEVSES